MYRLLNNKTLCQLWYATDTRPKCKVNLESVTVNCIISIHVSISKTHSTLTCVNERRVEYKANNQKYPADMSCGEHQFIILTQLLLHIVTAETAPLFNHTCDVVL